VTLSAEAGPGDFLGSRCPASPAIHPAPAQVHLGPWLVSVYLGVHDVWWYVFRQEEASRGEFFPETRAAEEVPTQMAVGVTAPSGHQGLSWHGIAPGRDPRCCPAQLVFPSRHPIWIVPVAASTRAGQRIGGNMPMEPAVVSEAITIAERGGRDWSRGPRRASISAPLGAGIVDHWLLGGSGLAPRLGTHFRGLRILKSGKDRACRLSRCKARAGTAESRYAAEMSS